MSYLSLLISLFKMMGSELTGNAWWDAYFDTLVGVETWFFKAGWVLFGIAVGLAILSFVLSGLKKLRGLASGGLCFGCAAAILLTWPLWEWITLSLARGMASSFGPEGIINQGKFIMSLVLYILLGAG